MSSQKTADIKGEGRNRGSSIKKNKKNRSVCLQDSHVHDVCFMQRLVFNLWVDDGRVRDPCGVGTWGAGHHVV